MTKVSESGRSYDYVIVGAGSAGCVLANRLTKDDGVSVLLLEAGKRDWNPLLKLPLATFKVWNHPRFDWGYLSEPEPNLNGRRIPVPRGKLLGGSSSINAMVYTRGHPLDYDQWRQLGLDGWGYADVLPYFKRSETNWRGESPYHGGAGPLHVSLMDMDNPVILDAFAAAGRACGFGFTEDVNGACPEGFGPGDFTIGRGRRASTATAYLRPAIRGSNLTVETGALVTRIVFEGNRAVGVDYRRGARSHSVRAEREVVLSGGAINSPQLLMLSGVGPADALRSQGIDPVCKLSGVGQGLRDHLSVAIEFECTRPVTLDTQLRFDRIAVSMARWLLFGTGPAAHFPSGACAHIRTRPELDRPDIQFLVRNAGLDARVWFPLVRRRAGDAIACRITALRPESRGNVRLRSADPADPPRILHNYLATAADLAALRTGFTTAREVFAQTPMAELLGAEVMPGPKVSTADEIDAFIRATATTIFHPVSTCRMGVDDEAVVDGELKVRGLEGLRVVDASVMPTLPGANTNAAVIMIAEKATDMILGRAPLPAELPGP